MAYTAIDNPELFFQTKLYTGTNASTSFTLDGSENMQPDWVWLKVRAAGSGQNHTLFDSVRGATKYIEADENQAETTGSNFLTSFDSNGFTLGNDQSHVNASGDTYVAWNWKAGAGSGSSNTDGTINTTSTSVSTTAGFSISKYTGTGSNATFGHGLGVTPDVIWWKRLDNDNGGVNWIVQTPSIGTQNKLVLNTTEATTTGSSFSATSSWTSSTVDLKTYEGQNSSSAVYVAYCFAEKKGYSKFGTYKGNGSADGTFVHTGFKPAWTIIKRTDSSTGGSWILFDSKRGANVRNPIDVVMAASNNQTEADWGTAYDCDYLSNGFKWRHDGSSTYVNVSDANYFYMAFAENPFVNSNGVPNNAR